ncbi:MAG TPA: hypothetical protein DIW23_07500 [Anaerolineae bacterium]|nr:hypothetical protein [Anaerolineae bacterium]
MKSSSTRKVLAGILIVILGCVATFWAKVIYPINKFERAERESIPKFDALNEKIAEDLPSPPDGIEFIKMQQLGIDYSKPINGRILVFYYSVPSYIDMADDQIESYYQDILLYYQSELRLKGWEILKSDRSSSYFRGIELQKNTACILIEFIREKFEITIWHDYLNQSFSPTLPDKQLLNIINVGKTDIWTCPYYG